MEFPDEVDYVIVGTGLPESMIAAGLAITGNSVIHLDRDDYYGGLMCSFRFPDLLSQFEKWSNVDAVATPTHHTGLSLVSTNDSLIRNCSSRFYTNPATKPDDIEAPSSTDLQADTVPHPPMLHRSTIPTPLDLHPTTSDSETTIVNSTQSEPVVWTECALREALRRSEFDIFPKLIFAESPFVAAMVRSDVQRYLEFRSVNRLLTHDKDFDPQTPDSPKLIKVPVSRGEMFQTRLLSLTQKRMLVGFLEWCAGVTVTAEEPIDGRFGLEPEEAAYLDRPLADFLREKRNLDGFVCRVVTNCFALATDGITLRQALPRFRRLLSSMNRVGPFPLLWPIYGCAELPQSFCRMCAVFSGTYCLGRTVTGVARRHAPVGGTNQRRYTVTLTTGEEISTSSIVLGASQAPADWIIPQVQRWIARAILVTSESLFPKDVKTSDVTLLPLPIAELNEAINEPGFLLETTVESRSETPSLFITHLTASSPDCVDPANLFAPIIDSLYAKEQSDSATTKPRLLWESFFSLPDLSTVGRSLPNDAYGVGSDGIFVVPGLDSTLTIDKAMPLIEEAFHLAYNANQQRRRNPNAIDTSETGETSDLTETNSAAFVSLDAAWDGVFPPRPPRPDELVFTDVESGETTSTVPVSAQPVLPPAGHGDWSVAAAADNTIVESEFTTANDP